MFCQWWGCQDSLFCIGSGGSAKIVSTVLVVVVLGWLVLHWQDGVDRIFVTVLIVVVVLEWFYYIDSSGGARVVGTVLVVVLGVFQLVLQQQLWSSQYCIDSSGGTVSVVMVVVLGYLVICWQWWRCQDSWHCIGSGGGAKIVGNALVVVVVLGYLILYWQWWRCQHGQYWFCGDDRIFGPWQ